MIVARRIKISRAGTEGDESEHVEAAVHDGLPALTKKGNAHHRTTGVARANSIQAQTLAENRCCIGVEGRNAETISASMGTASATLIHSVSSYRQFWLESSAVTSRVRAPFRRLGRNLVHHARSQGASGRYIRSAWLVRSGHSSSAMPHFGQLPGPVASPPDALGSVFPCGPVFEARCAGCVWLSLHILLWRGAELAAQA